MEKLPLFYFVQSILVASTNLHAVLALPDGTFTSVKIMQVIEEVLWKII